MKPVVFISYGMGGAGIEVWETGLRQLVRRCKAIGLETMGSPYNWNDVNAIVHEINNQEPSVPIAVIGASLGANEAPAIAGWTKRAIRYIGGFQASIWGENVSVPANVDYADLIYNPGWIGWLRTFGMGSAVWQSAAGNNHTVLRLVPVYEGHPDDWGVAQDIIFSRVHNLLPS